MHVDSTSFPAVMLINSMPADLRRAAYIPAICKPLHTSSGISHHCSVVYISFYGKHARDPIEIGEDRIHCDAEKQDGTIIFEGNNLPCTLCLHLRKRRICRVYMMTHKGALHAGKDL